MLCAELLQDTGDCGQGSLELPDLGLHGDWVHRERSDKASETKLWPGLQCTVDGGSEAMFKGDKECW